MSFTSLDAVKTSLSIPLSDTTHDARLQAIVDAVNTELLGIFNLTSCTESAYTNKYDIWDSYTQDIWLHNYPVTTVTEVKFNGSVVDDTLHYQKERFKKMGMLSLVSGDFPVGRQKVEVTHNAGWAGGVVDSDLAAAAGLMVIVRWNTDQKLGFTSERIGQYFYQLGGGTSAGIGASGAVGLDGRPIQATRVLQQWIRPFVPDE